MIWGKRRLDAPREEFGIKTHTQKGGWMIDQELFVIIVYSIDWNSGFNSIVRSIAWPDATRTGRKRAFQDAFMTLQMHRLSMKILYLAGFLRMDRWKETAILCVSELGDAHRSCSLGLQITPRVPSWWYVNGKTRSFNVVIVGAGARFYLKSSRKDGECVIDSPSFESRSSRRGIKT